MLVVSAGWDIETGVDVLTVEMLTVEVDLGVMDVRSCVPITGVDMRGCVRVEPVYV